MEYMDFELEIERVGKGKKYRARVRKAPAGKGARTLFALPVQQELEDLQRHFVNIRSGAGSRNLQIDGPGQGPTSDLGLRLFQSIFTGKVLESWRVSLAQAHSRLRLRLSLDNDPHLLSVPWELLFDPDLKDFVATAMPVVRALDIPADHQRPLAGPGPLRILTVLSCPSDCAPIDTEQEWQVLDGALGDSVELRSVPPRLEEIDRALEREAWHVLHFVGHGVADDQGGALILEDREGGSRSVDHLRLGKFLSHTSLRLIVLNACDGGLPGRSDAFSGVAQALLRKGIPAVVAMQQPISDRAAIIFAKELYGAIAEGLPLDDALVVARERLYRDFETEWAIPVLYLNAPNGEIIASPPPLPPPSSTDLWKRIALITTGVLLVGLMVWVSLRPPSRSPEVGPTRSLISQTLNLKPMRSAAENPPDCPSPKGLDIAFEKIGGGTFEMGDNGDKIDRPVHQVSITRPFCLGTYEITRKQWHQVRGGQAPLEAEENLPVQGITYEEAQQFVARLNETEPQKPCRLPTEAEWEYASRAGERTRYSFGDAEETLVSYGNCKGGKDGFAELASAGQLEKNPLGLYDMYGNVYEWVLDWYEPYHDKPASDPVGPDKGEKRIRRGGSWGSRAHVCGSGHRSIVRHDWSDKETGFRIVRKIR